MEKRDLQADLDLCNKATPGPWQWYGNTKFNQIYLATINRGRIIIMDFVRWGMQYAMPRFQLNGIMEPAKDLVCYERDYRKNFVGLNHPDAIFIAAARDGWPHAIERALAAEAKLALLQCIESELQEYAPYDVTVAQIVDKYFTK